MEELTLENSERKYWQEIKAIAEDIKNELERDDTLEEYDLIHENIDGSQWLIYYWQQKLVLLHTDNLEAIEDVIGEINTKSANLAIQQIAFYAMYQDVVDRLQNILED